MQHVLLECGAGEVGSLNAGGDAAKYVAGLPPYELRQIPDLIFVDINMPGIEGFSLICWLQRNPIFQEIPMIVLSGSNDPKDKAKAKAMEMGATAFYGKPVDTSELKAIMENILNDVFADDNNRLKET